MDPIKEYNVSHSIHQFHKRSLKDQVYYEPINLFGSIGLVHLFHPIIAF